MISTKITEWKFSRWFFGDSKRPWNYRLPVTSYKKSLDILRVFFMSTEHTFYAKKTPKLMRLCIFKTIKFIMIRKYFLGVWDEKLWMKNYYNVSENYKPSFLKCLVWQVNYLFLIIMLINISDYFRQNLALAKKCRHKKIPILLKKIL